MARDSIAHLLLATEDVREARDRIRAVFDGAGFRTSARLRGDAGFLVTGIRGSSFLAWLGSQIPLGGAMGLWAKVGAQAKAQRSLDEGDERIHLWVRVWPVRELTDDRETFRTQGFGEMLGDHLQCRRVFKRILDELDGAAILAPLPERPPRAARGAGPARRGSRRR